MYMSMCCVVRVCRCLCVRRVGVGLICIVGRICLCVLVGRSVFGSSLGRGGGSRKVLERYSGVGYGDIRESFFGSSEIGFFTFFSFVLGLVYR